MNLAEMIKALLDEAKAIYASVKKEGEDDALLSDEQLARVEEINAEVAKLQKQLDAQNAMQANADAAAAAVPARTIEPTTVTVGDPPPAAPVVPSVTVTATPGAVDPKGGFPIFGAFMDAVRQADNPAAVTDQRLNFDAQAGLNQQTGSQGGFLVPTEFGTDIMDVMRAAVMNLYPMTTQFTITGEAIELPLVDEKSRKTGQRWGGLQGFWINEADNIPRSNPKFRRARLEPHQLAVLVPVTDKLLRNASMALGQFLSSASGEELAFLTSDAVINGTGAGQPLGILNSTAAVTVAKESGQAAATIVFENITKMWQRMWAPSRRNARWLINQDIEAQLSSLALDVGTGGAPAYLPANGLSAQPFATLFGRPILPTEYNSTLGTRGDIILADLSAYLTGTAGQGIEAATSIHVLFESAQTLFRFMWAADGQPAITVPLTPKNGTQALSPFVTLATRS